MLPARFRDDRPRVRADRGAQSRERGGSRARPRLHDRGRRLDGVRRQLLRHRQPALQRVCRAPARARPGSLHAEHAAGLPALRCPAVTRHPDDLGRGRLRSFVSRAQLSHLPAVRTVPSQRPVVARGRTPGGSPDAGDRRPAAVQGLRDAPAVRRRSVLRVHSGRGNRHSVGSSVPVRDALLALESRAGRALPRHGLQHQANAVVDRALRAGALGGRLAPQPRGRGIRDPGRNPNRNLRPLQPAVRGVASRGVVGGHPQTAGRQPGALRFRFGAALDFDDVRHSDRALWNLGRGRFRAIARSLRRLAASFALAAVRRDAAGVVLCGALVAQLLHVLARRLGRVRGRTTAPRSSGASAPRLGRGLTACNLDRRPWASSWPSQSRSRSSGRT